MTSIIPPMCHFCVHLRARQPGDDQFEGKCAAFPQGIPRPIWISEADHRKPYPGDNGITFEGDLPPELVPFYDEID